MLKWLSVAMPDTNRTQERREDPPFTKAIRNVMVIGGTSITKNFLVASSAGQGW